MSSIRPPQLEKRRARDFERELFERARAWIPSWALDDEGDFGRALFKIAARFSSEVAERLDRAPDKMWRGFFDWLGVRAEAAHPARMPVVFKMSAQATEAVLAEAPVSMQVDVQNAAVVFESETDVRLVPGNLATVVAANADSDEIFFPPPGLTDIETTPAAPEEWRVKSFASPGSVTVQLDPETGLAAGMIVEIAGQQYRIETTNNDIVTIDPPVVGGFPVGTVVEKVSAFSPFDGKARNRQEHALYIGDTDVLNIEAAATIEIVGAAELSEDVAWQYWGKVDPEDEVGWQPLKLGVSTQADILALEKLKGAIEPREINGQSSRWIRAFKTTVADTKPLLRVDSLGIRVNCSATPPCPPGAATAPPSPAAEGMANTTPLVLETVFFPLGKEPRQFDAFYLGSAEAFSKKGAQVQLCFEMADLTFTALAPVLGGALANKALVGVSQDSALHLLKFDPNSGAVSKFDEHNSLRPPLPAFPGQTPSSSELLLTPRPPWRPPVWTEGDDFLIAVSAGAAIWVWHEKYPDQNNSGWRPFGELPVVTTAPVDALVYLQGPLPALAALLGGRLFIREWPNGSQWTEHDTLKGSSPVTLKSLVPIVGTGMSFSSPARMVGVSANNELFSVSPTGACSLLLPGPLSIDARPIAVDDGVNLTVAAVDTSNPSVLETYRSVAGPTKMLGASVVGSLEGLLSGGQLHVVAALADGSVVTWAPFEAGAAARLFQSKIPGAVGQIGGTPTLIGGHIIIPGSRADLRVADFDMTRRLVRTADVETGIVVPDSIAPLAVGDLVVRQGVGAPESHAITDAAVAHQGEVFYPIAAAFSLGATGPLVAYRLSSLLPGSFPDPGAHPELMQLAGSDHETTPGMSLHMDGDFFTVQQITTSRIATLAPPPPAGATGSYATPLATGGRVAPFMDLDASNNDWNATLLQEATIVFPGASAADQNQRGEAFSRDPVTPDHPKRVVLGADWASPPVPGVGETFIVDAVVGAWSRLLGDASTNPELSWEYWNGTGWWKLDVTLDQTLNLKNTGVLRFEVPPDIAPTDWSGRTNHWIRARLIGGDYGREKITVITSPGPKVGVTEQTVERSIEGIRAPSVLSLHISYSICDEVLPTFVLAQDSGSTRDQSDANRTDGAIVEAFVPLSVSLGRLLKDSAPAVSKEDECPPECDCAETEKVSADDVLPQSSPLLAPLPVTRATGRSLFLGFDRALSGATVNVLLTVPRGTNQDDFAPLTIETLVGDKLVPLVAKDATRALGETGLLTLSFAEAPTQAGLFGAPRFWVRLSPHAGERNDWSPTVLGAYLNAVWASATETLTRELVGSSDGEPNLKLTLARPPVLRDSLVLRVKEPLSDEERAALVAKDADKVFRDERGDWVLWEQVLDTDDEDADRRVYSLDETSGEIRFGDGKHGRIPPIGRDSMVAFSYKRTEPPVAGAIDVPANAIEARAGINLVTPVPGVEAAFSADHAAGGAPAEPDARVLRFGMAKLRHRGRAVTLQDLEDLALQSSPDIAQARAIVRGRNVRLVTVIRGADPVPGEAQKRELKRLLLSSGPPSLKDGLEIRAPKVRRLRVRLHLRVESLDYAGAVAEAVKSSLTELFDTLTGSKTKEGWPLGASPREEDIALALIDVAHLSGIAAIELVEILNDGTSRAWPDSLAAHELARLAGDPVRVQFESIEAAA